MSSPSAPVDSPMGSPCANSPSQSSSGFVEADTKGAKSEPRPLYDTLGNEFTIPDFTMKQVFDAIPKHCFQRSTIRGLSYALCDCLLIASTFYIFYNYATPEIVPNKLVRGALWTVYTIIQGMLGMGIWVLAHECCHRAFSESKFVCDLVGFVFHSSVLMPYFSWQISHRKHHRMSGNIAKDMLYIPRTREEYASRFQRTIYDLTELTEESPITTMLELFLQHLFGFSLYLLGNATGPDNHEDQPEGRGKGYKNGLFGGVNHFNPRSPLFDHKDVKAIIYSDIGVFLVGTILYHGVKKFGWANMLVWYFAPWLWLHSWLGIYDSQRRLHFVATPCSNSYNCSCNHISSAYRPHSPALFSWRLDLHPRRCCHYRSRIWLPWKTCLPRRHRDPCGPSSLQQNSLLPRQGGYWGYQTHNGTALPIRQQEWSSRLFPRNVETCPDLPMGRADGGRRRGECARFVLSK